MIFKNFALFLNRHKTSPERSSRTIEPSTNYYIDVPRNMAGISTIPVKPPIAWNHSIPPLSSHRCGSSRD
ncbi:hypothetical protein NPIL_169791 [Nephila pilipes]|uniref:Uncharacterized protein n=1 Tax=Nephila pilipes TaxID=299642 RepID=A0A8X6MGT4_NEPPI|nr:hypothetical protein NPIL_169791 [Nephila pilipes]